MAMRMNRVATETCGTAKGDLAQMYFPDRSRRSATNGLAKYIERCVGLNVALERTGYSRQQRVLLPSQVALIYEYLGEP